MRNRSSADAVVLVGCLVVTVAAASILTTGYGSTRGAIVFAVVLTALIAFFGFLWIGIWQQPVKILTDQSMRTAIAAATVLGYLVMVGMGVWFPATAGESSTTAIALLTNFTAIVGVVVAFYFGSTAYVDAKKTQPGGTDAEGSSEA